MTSHPAEPANSGASTDQSEVEQRDQEMQAEADTAVPDKQISRWKGEGGSFTPAQ